MARPVARVVVLAALALFGGPARAQQGLVMLPGSLALGQATQPARFGFGCTGNAPGATGALAVALHVPGHAALRAVFDFDAYEGPDARAGRRTRLGATEQTAAAAQPLAAPIRGDASGLREIAQRLAPLLDQGRLVWIQGNTRRGGAPIVAALQVAPDDLARVRERLAPCLAAARR